MNYRAIADGLCREGGTRSMPRLVVSTVPPGRYDKRAQPSVSINLVSTTLFLPRLAVSMTEGTIREWLVEDGAEVTSGQSIYVLETDKTEAEIEAPASGVLHIEADTGEALQVGTPIGEIE
jgi:biotin carboxyl carrier protein